MGAAVDARPVPAATANRPRDGFRTFVGAVSTLVPLVLVVIVLTLFQQAWPAITHFGVGFLAGIDWNPVTDSFGALPAIFGTVSTAFIALALALPVGVAVAVVLAEPGHDPLAAIRAGG